MHNVPTQHWDIFLTKQPQDLFAVVRFRIHANEYHLTCSFVNMNKHKYKVSLLPRMSTKMKK